MKFIIYFIGVILFFWLNYYFLNSGGSSILKNNISILGLFIALDVMIFSGIPFVFLYLVQNDIINQNKKRVKDIIIPIYKIGGLHPAIIGYLIDNRINSRDILAGVVNLIQKEIIILDKVQNKRQIILLKDPGKIKDILDRGLLEYIFNKNIKRMKKNDKIFYLDFLNSERDIWLGRIANNIKVYMQKNDFFEKPNKKIAYILLILGLIFAFLNNVVFVGIGLIFIIVSFAMLIGVKKTYSKMRWKTQNEIEGFKLFLNMTEKDRLKILNNDKEYKMSDFIPYVIAFNIDRKIWKNDLDNIDLNLNELSLLRVGGIFD